MPNKLKTGEHGGQVQWRVALDPSGGANAKRQDTGHQEQHGHRAVDPCFTCHNHHPGDAGAGNSRRLVGRGVPGQGIGKSSRGHESRHDRLLGWRLKRPSRAKQGENHQHERKCDDTGDGEAAKHDGTDGLHRDTGGQNAFSRQSVRRDAGQGKEQKKRHDLHQADQTQVKGPARHSVDLPADSGNFHIDSESSENASQPIAAKVCIGKCSSARSRAVVVR